MSLNKTVNQMLLPIFIGTLLLLTKRLKMLLQLLKSRTVLFALFLAVLSILQGYVNLLPLSPTDQMFVGIAISVVVTLLRIVTTQPISEK